MITLLGCLYNDSIKFAQSSHVSTFHCEVNKDYSRLFVKEYPCVKALLLSKRIADSELPHT